MSAQDHTVEGAPAAWSIDPESDQVFSLLFSGEFNKYRRSMPAVYNSLGFSLEYFLGIKDGLTFKAFSSNIS